MGDNGRRNDGSIRPAEWRRNGIKHAAAPPKTRSHQPGNMFGWVDDRVQGKGTWVSVPAPKKRHKWGLQAYMLAESNSGYCYNLEIYAGQRADDDVDSEVGGVTYATVMRLARPCFGRGYHLYFDNYYTSP